MLSCSASSSLTCNPALQVLLALPLRSCCFPQEMSSAGEAEQELARSVLNPEVFEAADAHDRISKELESEFGTLGLGPDAGDAPSLVRLCNDMRFIGPPCWQLSIYGNSAGIS